MNNKTPQMNIGNWHWTEKDFSDWATKRLKELLEFETRIADLYTLKVEADTVKGEAFKYVRKNKLHVSYNYNCSLKFKLEASGQDLVEGTVQLEPFVDEEIEDWSFEVKSKKKLIPEHADVVKKVVAKPIFVERIKIFISEFEAKNE